MNKYLKYFILLLIFLFITSEQTYASKKRIDSLISVINNSKEDSNKVFSLINLGNQYDYFNSKERIEYFISALNLSQKINYKNGIIKSYSLLIVNLSHRQFYDLALEYCKNYKEYLESNNLHEQLHENFKLYATLLAKQGKYDESLQYNHKALNYYLSKNNKILYATVLNNIGLLHLNNKHLDSAYFYGLRATEIFKRNNMQSELANSTLALAEINIEKNDLKNARLIAFHALEIYKNANIELGVMYANTTIGNIDFKEKKYDSAIVRYNLAVELLKKYSLPELKRDSYLSLSQCYANLKNDYLAYKNHVLYAAYKDSVSDQRLKNKTIEMDAKYNITKKEGELREKELEIISQTKQRNFLVLGIIGFFITMIILYRGYRQKKKANYLITEQKRIVDEKQKEILDSIKYSKRIQNALLPSEKFIERKINSLKK
ncbi:MAG: tetratricopeptide repeat protein [Bacteroidota bacterium]|nr:tetratricopeptide repeat protein [Bacteroidota bacterium]